MLLAYAGTVPLIPVSSQFAVPEGEIALPTIRIGDLLGLESLRQLEHRDAVDYEVIDRDAAAV